MKAADAVEAKSPAATVAARANVLEDIIVLFNESLGIIAKNEWTAEEPVKIVMRGNSRKNGRKQRLAIMTVT